MNIWIVIASLIISALAIYAAKLLWQLKKQTDEIKIAQQQQQAELNAKDHKTLTSVALIVRAMQVDQCELSEGCWRLSVLLNALKTSTDHQQKFPAIFGLYNSIKHMAILDQRKDLTKQQRMKEDFERMKFEAQYQDSIKKELDTLAEFTQQQLAEKAPITTTEKVKNRS
jgi:hypothetical protein